MIDNIVDMDEIKANFGEFCEPTSRLPDEIISFNPSDKGSIDKLLSKYGPEGVWEISDVLRKICMEDMTGAMEDAEMEMVWSMGME